MIDIVDILRQMAPTGTPPKEGCSEFGVGYDEAFERLKHEFIQEQFGKGESSEKFVVGTYGSGKTHFLRQFLEMAQLEGCATCEIQLSKDIDLTEQLPIYKEIVSNLSLSEQPYPSVRSLLELSMKKVRFASPDPDAESLFLKSWIDGLEAADFAEVRYKRVLAKTLRAMTNGDSEVMECGTMWLEGDVANRSICKPLMETPITASEQNRFGRKAVFTLCQFLKAAGFRGTIIALDEAEQAAEVGKKKLDGIMSMLRSEADAIGNVRNASIFLLYAFTPDVIQAMYGYPALQQRISEPDEKYKFFDGNVHTPLIELEKPYEGSSLSLLQKIGERLVTLFCDEYAADLDLDREDLVKASHGWANETDDREQSSQRRRAMVKLTCSKLLEIYDKGGGDRQKSRRPAQATIEEEV